MVTPLDANDIIMFLAFALGICCAAWIIYDVWKKNKTLSTPEKVMWTLWAILLNYIAAIIYSQIFKKK